MTSRIGIDIGGTFTDLVCFDEQAGQLRIAKVPTTPGRPEEGCRAALEQAGLETLLPHCGFFLHGTTVGLNALLERRGAIVGLLCTAGFRDILEIRRGNREKYYDLTWLPPEPLVPRRLRLGVTERVRSDGARELPLAQKDVVSALSTFKAEGVNSIAVV
jgi:N-methylhydantoinase A